MQKIAKECWCQYFWAALWSQTLAEEICADVVWWCMMWSCGWGWCQRNKNRRGYPLVNVYITMENHHVEWENPLFPWPCSIAMLVITRPGNQQTCHHGHSTSPNGCTAAGDWSVETASDRVFFGGYTEVLEHEKHILPNIIIWFFEGPTNITCLHFLAGFYWIQCTLNGPKSRHWMIIVSLCFLFKRVIWYTVYMGMWCTPC